MKYFVQMSCRFSQDFKIYYVVNILNIIMLSGQVASVVPEDCLGCLCQASTKCNLTVPCTSGPQYLCGPFLISWAYWADAGKFVLANDDPDRKGGRSIPCLLLILISSQGLPYQIFISIRSVRPRCCVCWWNCSWVHGQVCPGKGLRDYTRNIFLIN